jgi:hypothetical protein
MSVVCCRDNRPHGCQTNVITLQEIALLRLAAQRIAGPSLAAATETVRWQTASQAQDRNGVVLRTSLGTRESVEAAFNVGDRRIMADGRHPGRCSKRLARWPWRHWRAATSCGVTICSPRGTKVA